MVLAMIGPAWFPAAAATIKPELSVRISALSPAQFKPGSTVTMSGTVTNNNKGAWTNVQAYLVMAHAPYTSRSQLDDAISSSTAYTGERVVDLDAIDIMGNLAPGQSRTFTVKVPYGLLEVSGADGVYPVGVQILGTDADGNRPTVAIARATTFLPMLSTAPKDKIAASIGWPFLMPDYRGSDGNYVDSAKLLTSIGPGGQLRNLLDLARSTSNNQSTIIVDPALLVGVDDLAQRRHLAKNVNVSDLQSAAATAFLNELLTLARNGSCWILGYDRPDVLALEQNKDLAPTLNEAVDKSTLAALDTYGLIGRRITWPTRRGVTPDLLKYVRGPGDQPVIVDAKDLSGWSRRDGSLVQYQTASGPLPLLIDDAIDDDVPGQESVISLRQRILSESALAVLLRAIDPSTKADAIALVDPSWNPGADWAAGQLSLAFQSAWTSGASLDNLLTRPLGTFQGSFPPIAEARPLSRAQLAAATKISAQAQSLNSVLADNSGSQVRYDRDTATAIGVRWRKNRGTGLTIARSVAARAGKELSKITIDGPQAVTLSSSSGKFPLTISNDTKSAIEVRVRLDSSNPALAIPDVPRTTIEAGERRTLTVNVDVSDQRSTYVSASLITPGGKSFGTPAVFQVRSSAVGAVLWVAIGLAALLVVVALGRRFTQHRRETNPV